jgi:hypothetical protein
MCDRRRASSAARRQTIRIPGGGGGGGCGRGGGGGGGLGGFGTDAAHSGIPSRSDVTAGSSVVTFATYPDSRVRIRTANLACSALADFQWACNPSRADLDQFIAARYDRPRPFKHGAVESRADQRATADRKWAEPLRAQGASTMRRRAVLRRCRATRLGRAHQMAPDDDEPQPLAASALQQTPRILRGMAHTISRPNSSVSLAT